MEKIFDKSLLGREFFYDISLPRLRLKRFRKTSTVITIASIIYGFLVIGLAPFSAEVKLTLFVLGLFIGPLILLYFLFIPNNKFNLDNNLLIVLIGTITLALAVHLTGGTSGPFFLLYTLAVFSVIIAFPLEAILLNIILIASLIILHTFLSPTTQADLIRLSPLNSLFIYGGSFLLIFIYGFLIIHDVYKTEGNFSHIIQRLQNELNSARKSNLLNKTYHSLGMLKDFLDYKILVTNTPSNFGKLLGADSVLLFLSQSGELKYTASWIKKYDHQIKDSSLINSINKYAAYCFLRPVKDSPRTIEIARKDFRKILSSKCSSIVNPLKLRQLIISPLVVSDNSVGLLVAGFTKPAQIAEFELEIIKTFSESLALALENSRFYSETKESFDRYSSIISALVDALVLVDNQEKITLFNNQAESLFALKAHQAVGNGADSIIKTFDETGRKISKKDSPWFKALRTNKVIKDNKLFIKNRQGKLIPVAFSAKGIKNESGEMDGSVVIIRSSNP
ncbi:MAG: hypothetical protein A2134_00325 [Candidatus Woykebacteria bacterium RBG_16_39_9b]|uniref:PAS domain-containing protein n=1 Tax=Candidatus Woykebacteria bacterium RBG_16_39_9b TaxID=1802595 RepID=A0A1G1WDT0_9BACT|nr:MAG: hypothetical protein A2134_00325 [Candidatus Woykebacteria bacterium RBG_16_39_9b]